MSRSVGIRHNWRQVYELAQDAFTVADLSDQEIQFVSDCVEAYNRAQELLRRKFNQRGYAKRKEAQSYTTIRLPTQPTWPVKQANAPPVRGFVARARG